MKTKTLNVTCNCMATYDGSIEVPADMSLEDAIEYAKEHIDRINVTELEYVYDSDSIYEGSCSFDEDEVLDYKDKEIKPIATVDELIKAINENTDWKATKCLDSTYQSYIQFYNHSPAGEEISFEIYYETYQLPCEQIQEIISNLDSYYECFDAEDHLKMLFETKTKNEGFQSLPDIKTLVEKADEIDDTIKNLCEFVSDLPKQDVIFKAINIEYDVDKDDDCKECNLADEVEIEPIGFDYAIGCCNVYCSSDYEGVVELVSKKTGWCIKSCKIIQVINNDTKRDDNC